LCCHLFKKTTYARKPEKWGLSISRYNYVSQPPRYYVAEVECIYFYATFSNVPKFAKIYSSLPPKKEPVMDIEI
jgi:hypothetical protein